MLHLVQWNAATEPAEWAEFHFPESNGSNKTEKITDFEIVRKKIEEETERVAPKKVENRIDINIFFSFQPK